MSDSTNKQGNHRWTTIFHSRRHKGSAIFKSLRVIPLFSTLKSHDLREIENIVHQRHYKAREAVFLEGEPGVGMYIIQSGEVTIFKDYQTPKENQLACCGTNDFFGEMALLNDEPRSATAIAGGESEILGIFKPDLFELFERKPRIGVKILNRLAEMLALRLHRVNDLYHDSCFAPQKKDDGPNDSHE
jgi:CRP/FNR family transcriptional regulator, cyclic AMP receptor protein